jgi:hypothetical protein
VRAPHHALLIDCHLGRSFAERLERLLLAAPLQVAAAVEQHRVHVLPLLLRQLECTGPLMHADVELDCPVNQARLAIQMVRMQRHKSAR